MKKEIRTRSLQDIVDAYAAIGFPEYQREPSVWGLAAKQRLIDSILRSFDISTLYYYRHDDKGLDCIDGRQRLNAIVSFFGKNKDDIDDNEFRFQIRNEVYADDGHPFAVLENKSYAEIQSASHPASPVNMKVRKVAKEFIELLRHYEVTEVILSNAALPEEFNLQFTRLNLGAILNSGEKLHAMIGALRDYCFGDNGLGMHPFLAGSKIPIRRFAREQTAAQIVAQVLSFSSTGQLTRTRYLDLQVLFKEHSRLSSKDAKALADLRRTLDILEKAFQSKVILRNRSITVSAVVRAYVGNMDVSEAKEFGRFLTAFLNATEAQVKLGRNFDQKFEYLLDFQRHLTQASVERPAVEARDTTLKEGFEYWKKHKEIRKGS